MKKIITICLIMVATFAINAQQKPTKEQTIKFIDRTLQMMTDRAGRPFQSVSFTEKELHAVTSGIHNGAVIKTDLTYSGFLWETLWQIYINETGNAIVLDFSKYPNKKKLLI